MTSIRFPEFIRSLENTKYPFIPSASLTNGTVSLLEGTFLDAHIYAVSGTSSYYISSVTLSLAKCTITIGDEFIPHVLTGEIQVPFPANTEVVRLTDVYGRSGGLLLSDSARLSLLLAWGTGTQKFERAQTEFCVTSQVPIPDPGITGFRLASGEIVSGHVWFFGDDGVVLDTEITTTSTGAELVVLRLNAVGDPLYLQRLCDSVSDASAFVPVNPIRTIHVVHPTGSYDCQPDAQGNFNIQMNDSLVADPALRIRTTPEGIVLEVAGSVPTSSN